MARAATGLGVRELAVLAGVAEATVSRLERGEAIRPGTIDSIRTALEAAGVVFLPENGNGPGVALRKG
jgi:transcriptional regulator with XRE-family HTH domain